MTYEIQSKSDFLAGTSLIVRIPEEELDKKALYTIQVDRPGFLLPFRYKSVDGIIEFVYQIGVNCKLQHLSGSRDPGEYLKLWTSLLSPLLDCGDWFLKPYSFVLSTEYLYCDKNSGSVSYIYIPSVRECSGYDSLSEMAVEVSKLITVADVSLENKVLRAIMQDFNPDGFLRMLKSYAASSSPPAQPRPVSMQDAAPAGFDLLAAPASASVPVHALKQESPPAPKPDNLPAPKPISPPAPESSAVPARDNVQSAPGDIFISIPSKGSQPRKKAGEPKDLEDSWTHEARDPKKSRSVGGLFYRNKEDHPGTPPGGLSAVQQTSRPCQDAEPVFAPSFGYNDETQCIQAVSGATGFRLVGSDLLPPMIELRISIGDVFTIGRYDAASGKRQSSFEFDKMTKAISRRHAAIERSAAGYSITDLTSSAGVFVNGQKLPPNTPYDLIHGCRVSFGNAGADYVWEE